MWSPLNNGWPQSHAPRRGRNRPRWRRAAKSVAKPRTAPLATTIASVSGGSPWLDLVQLPDLADLVQLVSLPIDLKLQ